MARIIFYIVLLLISFSMLLYSLIQRGFNMDPGQPGSMRLMIQILVFIGIVIAFTSVLKGRKDSSGK